MTFVNPFLGGGSVSLLAKAYGFRVVCNDLAMCSAVIGRAFIANGSVTLDRSDVALLLREPDVPFPHVAEERYVPSVFSREHAQFIDQALATHVDADDSDVLKQLRRWHRDGSIRVVKVSAAEFNPRFMGRLVDEAGEVRGLVIHAALALLHSTRTP